MHVKSGESRPHNQPTTDSNRSLCAYKIHKGMEFTAQNPVKHDHHRMAIQRKMSQKNDSKTSKASKIREEPQGWCPKTKRSTFSRNLGNSVKVMGT